MTKENMNYIEIFNNFHSSTKTKANAKTLFQETLTKLRSLASGLVLLTCEYILQISRRGGKLVFYNRKPLIANLTNNSNVVSPVQNEKD